MSTTVNLELDNTWQQVDLTQLSNVGSKSIELWVGNTAPIDTNDGHPLAPNSSVSSVEFEAGDLYWLRCKDGISSVCITRATNV